jgi:hypothetical protein
MDTTFTRHLKLINKRYSFVPVYGVLLPPVYGVLLSLPHSTVNIDRGRI